MINIMIPKKYLLIGAAAIILITIGSFAILKSRQGKEPCLKRSASPAARALTFGTYSAKRAAAKSPIEALRYE